ncbi:MAG: YXWGXW repeat-containing protein [Candidatus Cloacimonetes bacterium]|nr:YXWGXW repeat-containing protein [Candidatus Cloacimonadota bacterium]
MRIFNKLNRIIMVILAFIILQSCAPQVIYVYKKPPSKVVEIKPARKYSKAIWISGHWKWNRRKQKYVWVKGHWQKIKRNRHWVDGYWKKTPRGWFWIDGHWK